ncbi:GGDEF domain-containing protein [Aquabacter sp. P-9]|uniref:GGDEF domain-containing protein n=1 Tax=Aquabacter sediminis TaxID=3029197 RepID=UPI00237D5C4C|nr:diguanylate cyclase [Aquabacter sp. P-9]MDE1569140.1 diguanylate cyclase [Aquabacter sp. P-9]
MAGLPCAELLSTSIDTFITADGCRLIRDYMGRPEHAYGAVMETRYRPRAGAWRDATVTVRPATTGSATFTVILEDAQRAREDQYRSRLTQYTVERITDMVIWLDADARYVFVNPAATRLLGYTADELRTMRVWDIDPLFDEHRWREHWRAIEEKGSFKIETVNRSKSGQDIPIEVTVNLVAYEGVRYNCSIVRDISARKAAEAELRSLNDRILRLSITDALTGLANRRHFDGTLLDELEHHAGAGLPLSLVLLDIDSFKSFNDLYGHPAGDACLRRVASVLLAAGESGARAARYGGEEFAVILPKTDQTAAMAFAEGLRRAIEALEIVHEASRTGRVVTASFGVLTCIPAGPQDANALLSQVDAALYRAKRAGGNRVASSADTSNLSL